MLADDPLGHRDVPANGELAEQPSRASGRRLRPGHAGRRQRPDQKDRRQQPDQDDGEGLRSSPGRSGRAAQMTSNGVPTVTRGASQAISALCMRMQPCEGSPGISHGCPHSPWMPTTPPPGHSLSDE